MLFADCDNIKCSQDYIVIITLWITLNKSLTNTPKSFAFIPFQPSVSLYLNQSFDLQWKSNDWFLIEMQH